MHGGHSYLKLDFSSRKCMPKRGTILLLAVDEYRTQQRSW